MPQSWLTRPLTNVPRKTADIVAEEIDNAKAAAQSGGDRGFVKPFIAGATQGVGDVLSDMTSPLSLGLMAAGPAMGALRGVRGLGRIGALMGGAGAESGADVAALNRSLAESKDVLDTVGQTRRIGDVVQETGPARRLSKAERYTPEYPKTETARATEAKRLKAERAYLKGKKDIEGD